MQYFRTLVEEKGIDLQTIIEVEGESGMNFIPLEMVIIFLEGAGKNTQNTAMNHLTKIDFHNGDVMHFFTHVAKFMAR